MHGHQWFRATLRDQHGREVLDCNCGARVRVRRNPAGEIIEAVPENDLGSIVNVINDHSQLDQSRFRV